MTTIIVYSIIFVLSLCLGLWLLSKTRANSCLKYSFLFKTFSNKILDILIIKNRYIILLWQCLFGFVIFLILSMPDMTNVEEWLKNNNLHLDKVIFPAVMLSFGVISLIAFFIIVTYINLKQNKKCRALQINNEALVILVEFVKNIKVYSDSNTQVANLYNNKILLILLSLMIAIMIGAGAILPGISSGVLCVAFGIYDKLLDSVLNFFKDISKIQNSKGKMNLKIIILIKDIICITHDSFLYDATFLSESTKIDIKDLTDQLNDKIINVFFNH